MFGRTKTSNNQNLRVDCLIIFFGLTEKLAQRLKVFLELAGVD